MTALSPEFLVNGAILGLVAVVAASLRNLPFKLFALLKRQVIVTVVVDSRSDLFPWLIAYFNELPYSGTCRLVAATVRLDVMDARAHGGRSALLISPAPGFHLLTLKGRPLWVSRELSSGQQTIETIRISAFGLQQKFLLDMLVECVETVKLRNVGRTALYSLDRWAEGWQLVGHKRRRPLQSVVLNGEAELFRDDAARFLRSEEWYVRRGIPWRRGYLLYGPPGTGKTSLIFAIAGELNLSLCVVSLSDSRMSDHNFSKILQGAPPNSMVVIEDIDAFFNHREKKEREVKLSFSGFLNALDGVHSQEGRIIVMTTNHHELLDPALIRPGRVDLQLELGYVTEAQIRRMYLQFYPGKLDQATAFARTFDERITPAQIQAELLGRSDFIEDREKVGIVSGSENAS